MCQKMPPQSAKSLHYSLSRQNSVSGWQVTHDMWKVTHDTWHVTGYWWHLIWILIKHFGFFMVLVLLTAHAARFSVSRMWHFFYHLMRIHTRVRLLPVPTSCRDCWWCWWSGWGWSRGRRWRRPPRDRPPPRPALVAALSPSPPSCDTPAGNGQKVGFVCM